MGEMADDFKLFREIRKKERQEIEPTRFKYAVDSLMDAGHRVGRDPNDDKAIIVNGYINFWPYTGWYSGKGIGSGRGIHNLIKKFKGVQNAKSNA